jgi:hypothetical protein
VVKGDLQMYKGFRVRCNRDCCTFARGFRPMQGMVLRLVQGSSGSALVLS